MTRLIVHPGFHKTGTTTVQHQLKAARGDLAPGWAVLLRDDLADAPAAARAFSARRDPLELGLFQAALAGVFAAQNAPGIVISCEGLCGHMPGRAEAEDYGAAPTLMAALETAARGVFGSGLDLRFYLSTRAEGWIESVHWQHVRTGTLTEPLATFRARMAAAADLDAVVAGIAAAVEAPVSAAPIEQTTQQAQGPATPLLDLMELPAAQRARFDARERRNGRPRRANLAALADRFARINARLAPEAAALRKQALLEEIWARGKKERA